MVSGRSYLHWIWPILLLWYTIILILYYIQSFNTVSYVQMVRGNAIHFSPPWMHNSAVIKLPCLQYHESFPLFQSNVLFISYPLHPLNHLLISYAQPVLIAVFYSFHLYSQQICLPWQLPTLDNHAAFTCFTCNHIIHTKKSITSSLQKLPSIH